MAALQGYITQVQRLLHDSAAQFWSASELTDYINTARIRTVRDTGCYRQIQPITLSTGVEQYPFGGVTGFNITNGGSGYTSAPAVTVAAPGVTGGVQATATATVSGGKVTDIVVTNPGTLYTSAPAVSFGGPGTLAAANATFINAQTIDAVNMSVFWGNSRVVLDYRDFSTFNAFARAWRNYLGMPSVCSVYSYTTLFIAKIPDQPYLCELDSILQPPLLVDNTTREVLPIVMQDPVAYFAAHLAKIKAQRWDEADKYYQRYDIEVHKAINASYTRRLKSAYANG